MSEQYLGEIRLMSFHFAPKWWAFCNGQLLPIAQNQALFSLLGTTYGGNGQTTFALPNLQGRVPVGWGNAYAIGQVGGEVAHTLTPPEMPAHSHTAQALAGPGSTSAPSGALLASASDAFTAPDQLIGLATAASTVTGQSQPHPNMQPYAALNFCIALVGIFPSRN